MIELFKRIDQHLLPRQSSLQYGPYIWLIYLAFFFVSLAQYHPVEHSWIYASVGTLLFLILYFNGYWASAKQVKWNILGIVILGALLTKLTPGASVFFVYAGAFCCRLGNPRSAVIGLASIAGTVAMMSWLLGYGPFFYVPAILFTFMVGGINIYQYETELQRKELVLTQQEVRRLARTSERERIARDLHDLIGHTFSVITLKAELANKLIDKDIDKARSEIKALENISRDALSQVREVVTGYRTSDLNTELAHAKYVLESNDIHFHYQFETCEINEHVNKELAIMLKEMVTNILKHSHANRVNVTISLLDEELQLIVKDDGVGFIEHKHHGFGLIGLSERVIKLAGNLVINSCNGVEIKITIPMVNQHD